jgi:phiEco32-like amidoligase-type 2 protein
MTNDRLSKRKILTLGSDPEMFVFSGIKLLPAYEFLPSKEHARDMYWDGFQAEWKYDHENNYCQNNLVCYTRVRMRELQNLAQRVKPNARLSLVNVIRISDETLKTARPEHVELGCMPSYNAYGLKGEPVYDPRKLLHRFAGGHMHFGTWKATKPPYTKIVKTLDSILGVWSVGVARKMDDPIRRKHYGLPGEFRMPQYDNGLGVEYRVLSNWWLASPAVMQLTWDIGRLCVRLATSRFGKLWAGDEQETIETIKSCDYEQADKIMKRNEGMFRWLLRQVYMNGPAIDKAISISANGLHSVVEDPEKIPANWKFGEQWIPDAGAKWARWSTLWR